jgi:hypothetical protein
MKARDEEEEFDYIDMTEVNIENPTQRKKNLNIGGELE